jgi:hypothetical protein
MTSPTSEPDEQRSWVGTAVAARALSCSDETVKRRIRAGHLEGGRRPNGHWYVYRDQLTSDDEKRLRGENAELHLRITRLEAEAERRVLTGAEAALAEARRDVQELQAENRELLRTSQLQQVALAEMQEVLDGYLEGGELALRSADKFQASGKRLSRVNALLNEHLALSVIPDTAAELDEEL